MEQHALRCGHCAPGCLMLAVSYLEKSRQVDAHEVRELVSSNPWRRTGYPSIVQAIFVQAICAAAGQGG